MHHRTPTSARVEKRNLSEIHLEQNYRSLSAYFKAKMHHCRLDILAEHLNKQGVESIARIML